MKSSARGAEKKRARNCLIVDGYNIVAAQESGGLNSVGDLDAARDAIIDRLAQYRSFSGDDVVVVFDAYRTAQSETEFTRSGVRVVYTDAGETADHRIERLVYDVRDRYKDVTVATSDFTEQQVTFGGGALRISARELLRRLANAERSIREQTDMLSSSGNRVIDTLRQDVANILEKWRRQ